MFNPRISLENACDLHIHTAPDVFPRYLTDVEAARLARDHKMAAIMLKCHHESTVSRAIHTEQQVPGIRVFGGIVLNWYVGGINVAAVEAALQAGAKQIWMPTTHAEFHRVTFGSIGTYGLSSMDATDEQKEIKKGITVIDEEGKLIPEIINIVDLITQHDAIFGTVHLSPQEIFEVLKYTRSKGAKVLITHPFFKLPNLSLEDLQKMVEMGGIAEIVAVTFFNLPTDHHPRVHRIKEAIDVIGPSKFILSSDAGQPFNPNPVEAIRVIAESLFELGVSKTDLREIMVNNPHWLLGLDL
jgi:hypothetical protein